ncbi:hypothetical protein M438DRAFT_376874 [Aureobasidium pullulans EXF-150]|uniref:Aminoglycoside phosphotransferase domain-containing protein n=1 Tax=Aureobasidium pullulans EXF-150 TaxID=1043002 RepID=A0A074X739_AURPU|nr:uncharacterized protein M438DRAFT_376874 [Aureobasidium pullulans EXF-150]KEQ81335.1 hypothetical protein M438DRAFT_376874 [Aureobasidium pullulans EXF-150]
MSDTITALPAGLATLEHRTEIIKALIFENCGRKVISVAPLGRDSNNFVHLVDLAEAIGHSGTNTSASQPGTAKLDSSVIKVVVRLSNPNAMIDEEVRVENEVAAISLVQKALISYPCKIVPQVFAWQGSKHGLGWIVQEYLHGEQLSLHFSDLQTDKKAVMIQSSKHDVKGFGGLRFDVNGEVVAGRSSLWSVGPFSTYAEMYQAIFAKQLELTQATPLLDGWKGTGLQERLQRFSTSGGFANLLAHTGDIQPTLVHGDFGAENILIDPGTLQITGLLDFDFSHIASPADEYFYSFPSFCGLVPGPFEDEDLQLLRRYQTEGFPSTPSAQEATSGSVDWTVARLWQAALEKHHVASPKDIENITQLADIYWFLLDVCPPFFNLPRWLARKTDEQKFAAKKAIRENLDRYLRRWGY